ncbi:mitochondral 37S ribosomal protein S27 [Malassezia cuniculi]|uniref:Small ribosomal subunit protein mS33 n=1 Tax=Malassezia cuniculi TaxID=948313 RepID=A0AAF0J7J2_9BASI|nr:mitochondral 37S ribosomal protein S27 [Malassezia cuniculi]
MLRPPAKSLAALAQLRSKIFGTTYNPEGIRTGAKFLRKPLVGAAMLRYYPPFLKLRSLRTAVPEIGHLLEPSEVQRFADVERKRIMGKGPPKKGEGRRAVMKGRKK